MAQIGSVVLNVTEIGRATAFWRGALGYVPREGDNPGALISQGREGPALLLDETDRTHLDLHVTSEEQQEAEVERLISLGAQRVDWVYPDGANFVVLSDTEGNLFCVVNTEDGQRVLRETATDGHATRRPVSAPSRMPSGTWRPRARPAVRSGTNQDRLTPWAIAITPNGATAYVVDFSDLGPVR